MKTSICMTEKKIRFLLLILFGFLIESDLYAQIPCDPPLYVNAGTDRTIECGTAIELGEVEPVYEDIPLASSCTTPGQLTQGGGVYIKNVSTTGGLNGNNISNLNSLVGGVDPMGPNGWRCVWYSDYTTQLVESSAGSSFVLNISAQSLYSNPPYSIRVWIDWNNDGIFNNIPGEELVYTSSLVNTNAMSFNSIVIQIPSGQSSGLFRMRIRAKDNSPFVSTDGACTYNNSRGVIAPYAGYSGSQAGAYWFSSEIEDYSVKINSLNTNTNQTYSWSPSTGLNNPNILNPSAQPSETTSYVVTITDALRNCYSTDQVTITVNEIVPIFNQVPAVCFGDLFLLPEVSINGISGVWSPEINNRETTEYTFTPNPDQCAPTTTTMTVQITDQIIPSFSNPEPICQGSLFNLPQISDNEISGTWHPEINSSETTIYSFSPSEGQCASRTELTVSIEPLLSPDFVNTITICSGDEIILPIVSENGISGIWTPPVNNTVTTVYSFTPSSLGCYSEVLLTVEVNEPFTPQFSNLDPICQGAFLTLPSISVEGVLGEWSPPINTTETTTYTFNPLNGACASSVDMTIVIEEPITPTFNDISPICLGVQFTLPPISTNGISGTWFPSINNVETTLYTFSPDNNTCTLEATMLVVITPSFTVSLSEKINACQGDDIPAFYIEASGGKPPYSYSYSLNSENSVSIISDNEIVYIDLSDYPGLDNNIPNCYDLIIYGNTAESCVLETTSFSDFLCISPKPQASFITSLIDDNMYAMINTSLGGDIFEWDFGDNSTRESIENAVHKYEDDSPSEYNIMLIVHDDKGCVDTTYRIIKIEEELILFIPNSFTPNGNELNNIFRPILKNGIDPESFDFEIYNRWGECIFISKDIDIGWDGTYNGILSSDGVYSWKITIKTLNSEGQKVIVGHLNLLK